MSQTQQVICLNKEQIKTVLENMWKLRNVKLEEKMFEGKPSFSSKIKQEYNYTKSYTKFADNYVIYRCKSLEDNHNEIYITVETDHYDKQNILAISGFEHLIKNYLEESCNYPKPTINICFAFVITEAMKSHIPSEIFFTNCNVRLFSLCSLYPMIGSKTKLFGLTFDYKILPYCEAYNNKDYPIVSAGDPLVIALNGIEGELLLCARINFDVCVYKEYQIRRIVNKVKDLSIPSESGRPCPVPAKILDLNNFKIE